MADEKSPKTIEEIRELMRNLEATRSGFVKRVEFACDKTNQFGEDVSWAIGEISIEEAEEAVKMFFIQKLRTGL